MTPSRALLSAAMPLLLAAAACTPQEPPPAPTPVFKPQVWFLGQMHSAGTLTVLGGRAKPLHVDSTGRRLPDGALRLDQAIHWSGGKTDTRFWIMRPSPDGTYAVTLTDAVGPVAFATQGARAHLRFRMKGRLPMTMEQWMDLQPDGRTLLNRGVVRLLGVPIARLQEPIVHDPA